MRELCSSKAALTGRGRAKGAPMARDIIFVPLGGAEEDRSVVEAARAFAKALDAAIEAVFVGFDASSIALAAGDVAAAAATLAVREERERAEASARALAEELGFPLAVHADNRARASWRARLALFAVIDPLSARGRGPLADVFETLLLEERAPVLVPRSAPKHDVIAVAWDGSREAANALKAAEPLVARAREVRILQAADRVDAKDAESADPERARYWIRGRNEDAKVEIVSRRFDPAHGLISVAENLGPVDLIVAGAYGHARLREAVFGGVTRSLLDAGSPSLLLAH